MVRGTNLTDLPLDKTIEEEYFTNPVDEGTLYIDLKDNPYLGNNFKHVLQVIHSKIRPFVEKIYFRDITKYNLPIITLPHKIPSLDPVLSSLNLTTHLFAFMGELKIRNKDRLYITYNFPLETAELLDKLLG